MASPASTCANAACAASSSAMLDVLVGGVRLRDVAGAEDHGVDAGLRQQRRLGPERQVDRLARRARPAAARTRRCRGSRTPGSRLRDLPLDRVRRDRGARAAARPRPAARRRRRPAPGRSDSDSVARVGMTLKAMPPSSAATLRQMPLEARRARDRAARAPSRPARPRRAPGSAIGLSMPSTRDEWPPGPLALAIAAPMPRWRQPTRQPVGSQTIARSMPRACALSRNARMHDAAALLVAREQHADVAPRGRRRASASRMAAIAPLVSAAAEAVQAAVAARSACAAAWVAAVGGHGVDVRVQQQARRAGAEARVDVGVLAPTVSTSATSTAAAPSARSSPASLSHSGRSSSARVLGVERHQLGQSIAQAHRQ